MNLSRSFKYIAPNSASVLILGSMPGIASLQADQYYAHPRNLFWEFMGELFGFAPTTAYSERLEQLKMNRIALWDVAHQCERPGSLDADIRTETVIANDFKQFFALHPHIKAIFFNGQKAADLYRKLVLPELAEPWRSLSCTTLPSTSPANASISREEKQRQWLQVRQSLLR
jgi:hypoxanthine-DNA glycosylase